jgi:hypothetical protein
MSSNTISCLGSSSQLVEVHDPRPTVPYRVHRTETDGIASPMKKNRSSDVHPYCPLIFAASDPRPPFPSFVPLVPETWQLCTELPRTGTSRAGAEHTTEAPSLNYRRTKL